MLFSLFYVISLRQSIVLGPRIVVFEAVIMLSERQTDIALFSLLNLQHKRYYTFEN